jgi:predicted tellurium resistance membrane protein TerC
MGKMIRYAAWLALIVVGVVLALDLAYFVHGSLEWYPTEDDHEKVRLVTGMIAVVLTAVVVGLAFLLQHLGRGRAAPARSAG